MSAYDGYWEQRSARAGRTLRRRTAIKRALLLGTPLLIVLGWWAMNGSWFYSLDLPVIGTVDLAQASTICHGPLAQVIPDDAQVIALEGGSAALASCAFVAHALLACWGAIAAGAVALAAGLWLKFGRHW